MGKESKHIGAKKVENLNYLEDTVNGHKKLFILACTAFSEM